MTDQAMRSDNQAVEQTDIVVVPQALFADSKPAGEPSFFVYRHISTRPSTKNKIMLDYNMISLLQHGQKVLSYANKTKVIDDHQIVLLSAGNCLMSEKLAADRPYESLLFFFDTAALSQFLVKHAAGMESKRTKEPEEPFIPWTKDSFIQSYIASLHALMQSGGRISQAMLGLKFEELMLYLLEKSPQTLLAFQQQDQEDFDLRRIVEMHLETPMTLDELAFLCHMSVSTFKRRFHKLYNTSPSQYFRQRKMELAASLLQQGEHPSAVFYKVGFENHSSFSQSFRQYFRISPSQYQQRNLTV